MVTDVGRGRKLRAVRREAEEEVSSKVVVEGLRLLERIARNSIII